MTKWPTFPRRDFQMHFHEWKCVNFYYDFTEVCSWGSNKQYSSRGSDNGLAPTRWQAIIWTSDGYFTNTYMRHSASMSYTQPCCLYHCSCCCEISCKPFPSCEVLALIGPLHMLKRSIIQSMGKCKKDITPVRWQWSYVFLALTHQIDSICEHIQVYEQTLPESFFFSLPESWIYMPCYLWGILTRCNIPHAIAP